MACPIVDCEGKMLTPNSGVLIMKTLSGFRRGAMALAAMGLLATNAAVAQVESLNPNPTLPAGVGSAGDLEEYHHGTSGGPRIGIGGTDKNPAEIMLRELSGTHTGRRTGHAAIRGRPARAALRFEGLPPGSPLAKEGTVYFGRRGDYENSIYVPQHGSYRQSSRRQPAAQRIDQR